MKQMKQMNKKPKFQEDAEFLVNELFNLHLSGFPIEEIKKQMIKEISQELENKFELGFDIGNQP